MSLEETSIGELKRIGALANQLYTSAGAKPLVQERAVIVCTDKRGVFFGYTSDTSGETIKLRSARMAFFWSANQGGVLALASEGPRKGSKIGARADIELRGITCVIECTEVAAKVWEEQTWKP